MEKDISSWDLDYSDIIEIFKTIKIENTLKSIQSVFLNSRFSSKINYKPYFQRNYVWDKEKATYFIESILLGTEIPPLVLFNGSSGAAKRNEVIDGRQRYETLLNFINNDLELQSSGLHRLSTFAGYHYFDFDEDTEESFNNTKLRILQCSVPNEPSLTPEKEDKIKKEIFKRYNSGITPLKKEENARAEYINDPITVALLNYFNQNLDCRKKAEELLLSRSKLILTERDRVNTLLDRIRTLLALTQIPIYSYAKASRRSEIVSKFYSIKVSERDPSEIVNRLQYAIDVLYSVKSHFSQENSFNNNLLYECLLWGILIGSDQGKPVSKEDAKIIANDIINSSLDGRFWSNIITSIHTPEQIFESTGSHYRNATLDRYQFISNYFSEKYEIDFSEKIKNSIYFSLIMELSSPKNQLKKLKLIKPDPVSVTIEDILADMKKDKFLVRPSYQRSEVKNIQKSSYLLESIMLGIKIPPIYIYKRKDKVKEVIDGQQRILTLLGFLGKTYTDENGKSQLSNKHKFKLSGLKILKELNDLNIDSIWELYPQYVDNIYDFSIDIVEIDAEQNPEFNSIDLFLRLNTKPFPIKPNSFEMWNAYVAQNITQKIKEIANKYAGKIFRSQDTRMSNEELITALAYLHYQEHYNSAKHTDLLTVYLRDNHICARISSKDRITKMLEGLNAQDITNFECSIDAIELFIKKLCILVGEDGESLPLLLGTNHKTDQNFYFLWMILEAIEIEQITKDCQGVFEQIQKHFKKITCVTEGYTVDDFLHEITQGLPACSLS